MRFTTFATAGVFLAALFTMSMWPEEARFGAPETSIAKTFADDSNSKAVQPPKGPPLISRSTKRDAATEKALEQPISLHYEETQFSDVVAELSETSKLNFILHETAIDDSLTEEELVTISLQGVSMAKALELLLGPFNAMYTIDEGVVVIISRDVFMDPEFLRLKMFDCKKLVAALPVKERYQQNLGRTDNVEDKGKGGGGVFCLSDTEQETSTKAVQSSPPPEAAPVPTKEDTLLMLVKTMVEPDSWHPRHGEGVAKVIDGILIVRQTESALRGIGEMLRDLRGKVLGETDEIVAVPEPEKRKRPLKQQEAVKTPAEKSTVSDDPF